MNKQCFCIILFFICIISAIVTLILFKAKAHEQNNVLFCPFELSNLRLQNVVGTLIGVQVIFDAKWNLNGNEYKVIKPYPLAITLQSDKFLKWIDEFDSMVLSVYEEEINISKSYYEEWNGTCVTMKSMIDYWYTNDHWKYGCVLNPEYPYGCLDRRYYDELDDDSRRLYYEFSIFFFLALVAGMCTEKPCMKCERYRRCRRVDQRGNFMPL